MNISVVGKGVELTDPIKAYIDSAIAQFEKFGLDLIAVKAIVSEERKNKAPATGIEFTIQMARRDTVVIKQMDKDLYVAIDVAVERAKKVLRRYHDKIRDHIHGHPESDKNPANSDIPILYSDVDEEEVIPAQLDLDKPAEVEEAVEFLKKSNMMFVVFDDMDGKRRTLYRRKDGKFGLY